MAEPKTQQRDGKTTHFSVGALIIKDGKILLMDRKNPPFGYAGPAGHIDQGEDPVIALKREVVEETGFSITDYKLAGEEFVAWNTCSYGAKGHYWYLYHCEVEGDLKRDDHEAKSLAWYDPVEINNLEPVWEYWLKELKLI